MPMIYNQRRFCSMRHENGNCMPCGGFCTAVNDSICEALHKAFDHGGAEERDSLVLAMVKTNRDYQERNLEVLRSIQQKVSADAVYVVRCKDCKHWQESVDGATKWCPLLRSKETEADDFCSYGERKDNA